MSTDQPDHDPFRKPEPQEGPDGPPQGPGRSSPPPSYGGGPYGGQEPPPPPGGGNPYGGGGPYGGAPHGNDPYGGGPYGSNPYGDMTGAADPLAGMPPLASRGKRLVARIIDALLIGIPIGLIMGLSFGGWNSVDDGRTYAQEAVYTVVYLLYEGLMLTRSGQTVGKKLMRIRVAMLANGAVPHGSPGWVRVVVYHLPPLIPCLGSLFWLVNVLFCTWDKPFRQCLHDKAAKTVVVEAE